MKFIYDSLKHCTWNSAIVVPSLLLTFAIAISGILIPDTANELLNIAKEFIFSSFSWLYILCVSFFLLFMLFVCIGNLGDIKLGSDEEEPEYRFFSWICMLFAAGMGIGLMYFGVAEPISHYTAPLHASAKPYVQMKEAMLNTVFHWGIHAWAIYGLIGLSLAYFGFRYRLPLSIRSGFYPLLSKNMNGFWGNTIDVIALCSTIFGLTTTLGFGALQLRAGLMNIGLVSSESFASIILIIIVAVSCAIFSAISGVNKGVRMLSEGNLILAIALMIFVVVFGPTIYILSAFTENIGNYLTHIIDLSFRTFAYETTQEKWFTGWTVLYWSWWISWAPFVGLFIARISKGRTIREFVLGVLFLPTLFNLLWMTIFGNGAIWVDQHTQGALQAISDKTEALLFTFLNYFPFASITSSLAVLIIAIFFITSADSGIFVLNSIASYGKEKSYPKWQSIIWGILMALLAIALLYSGGLGALQTMTLVMALPFTIVMVAMALCLWKGLLIDKSYFSHELSSETSYWTGKHWKERLEKMITNTDEKDLRTFINTTVRPVFYEMVAEFETHGITASINEGKNESRPYIELVITLNQLKNFIYGVTYSANDVSKLIAEDDSIPTLDSTVNFEPICYFLDGRRGHSLKYMRKEDLITDILRQYERYLKMSSNSKYNLYLFEEFSDDNK